MRKNILYFIPVLLLFISCEDTLDRYPQDAVSSKYYFQNADQLQQYTNQFYTILPTAASCYDEISDLVGKTTLANEAIGNRSIPADASNSSWTWGMLRHINYFLQNVNKCSDEKARNHYTGVALFFRAYFYYDKVRRFGDVPWFDHTLGNTDEELYKPRDSRTTVMRNVVKDLNQAISLMNNEKQSNYRVNRYTAMALKSRACLFEGTFCKYHTELPLPSDVDRDAYCKEMLLAASDASKQLIEQGGYSLYTQGDQPYRDMFMMDDLRACPEIIMARGYDGNMNLKHNVCGWANSTSFGRPGFTKRLVNQYLCYPNGERYTEKYKDTYPTMAMGAEMNDRDPRMEQTIFRPGHYIRKGKTEVEPYDPRISITGYQIIKYVSDESHDAYEKSYNDMPIFRLAEIYLNYAEAQAELGKDADIAKVEEYINILRDRVHMAHFNFSYAVDNPCAYMESLYPNASKGADNHGAILEIRRERAIELVLEGHRYWDLMRWKEGKAFEQPYYGFSVPAVSKNEDDESGFMDMSGFGEPDMCIWINSSPFSFGEVNFYEANTELKLDKYVDNSFVSGFILADGTPGNITAGRTWTENRDYLYPLPTNEIVLSKGQLSQNPGWGEGY